SEKQGNCDDRCLVVLYPAARCSVGGRLSFLELRDGGPSKSDQNMDLPARCPNNPAFRSWMIPFRERSSVGVIRPVPNSNRPRMTVAATTPLLSNQLVTDFAPHSI